MKYANKVISTLLSLLILTTCVPVQAFAQKIPTMHAGAILAGRVPDKILGKSELYKPIPFRGIELPIPYGETDLSHVLLDINGNRYDTSGALEWEFTRSSSSSAYDGYREARELGKGWFVPARGDLELREVVRDIVVISDGCEHKLSAGTLLDMTTLKKTNGWVVESYKQTPEGYMALIEGYGYEHPMRYIRASEYDAKKIMAKFPDWTQEDVAFLVKKGVFGHAETYVDFERVKVVGRAAAEDLPTPIFERGVLSGMPLSEDVILRSSVDGKEFTMSSGAFDRVYVPDPELGEGWFKRKNSQPRKFVKLDQDMHIELYGLRKGLKKGDFLDVTDLKQIRVLEKEEAAAYKTIRALYQENLKGIRLLVMKVEQKLYKKFPKYSGVFFKRVLANDTDFMLKRLEQQAAKRAERNAAKAGAKRTILRAFGGALFGSALYFGITLATAPDAKANPKASAKKSDVIKRTVAQVEGLNAEQKDMLADIAVFMDPNAAPLIMRNPDLMEKMTVYSAIIQSDEFNVDDAAEFIADELGKIEMQGALPNQIKNEMARPHRATM